jgi:hypothetical protein
MQHTYGFVVQQWNIFEKCWINGNLLKDVFRVSI